MLNDKLSVLLRFLDYLSVTVIFSEGCSDEKALICRKLKIMVNTLLYQCAHNVDLIFQDYCYSFSIDENCHDKPHEKCKKRSHIALLHDLRSI